MIDLIICEKPSASKMVAAAFGDSTYKKAGNRSYFISNYKGNKIFIVSAAGHLFDLKKREYPIVGPLENYTFDFDWEGSWKLRETDSYKRDYFTCIKNVYTENKFDRVIIGCDFDIEGLLIGFMILTQLKVKKDKMFWMKMNSLAKYDVEKAYNNLEKPDIAWVNAGIARHEIDALFGWNMTKIFSNAAKKYRSRYRTISLGRVQSPTLHLVTEREEAIQKFVPEKYYSIRMTIEVDGIPYFAYHTNGDMKDKITAEEIINRCKNITECEVSDIKEVIEKKTPYHCFNISTCEQESWKYLHYTPKFVDEHLQQLYSFGLISYPRTGSTSLHGVPYQMVLDSLSNEQEYFSFTNKIRTEGFIPLSGGKSDLAHTAIYPTGKDSSFINNDYDKNILDIIKRRFISTFFPDLIMCRKFVTLFCSADFFILGSSNIVDQGWTEVYHFYKPEVVPIPDLKCGQKIIVKNIELLEHTTKPPSRYSFASLVREMEKISLGTKATRSDICKKLEDRGYIFTQNGSGITPTSLGKKLIEITLKYSPKISDIEMTRELEKNMDGISKGTISRSEVIEQARTTLKEILLTTTANMDSVGKELAEAMIYR